MDSRHVMSRLKETLAGLLSVIPPKSDIMYADYPLYGNVGDLLIMKGTEAFFKAHGIRVKQRWNPDNFPFGRRAGKETIIVCQGGGNFGDLYPYYQTFRERIVKAFPENRIVILPQTIYYQDKTRLRKTAALFAEHKDLHLFTRDHVSYETAKRFFSANHIGLMPDMAHQLYPIRTAAAPSRGKLHFIRTDGEINPNLQTDSSVESCDWQHVLSASDRHGIAFFQTLNVLNKKAGNPLPIARFWKLYSDFLTKKAVLFFSRYESVETSRLHGHILSSLLGKPNTVIDNSYGKNANYYHTWMHEAPDVRLIGETAGTKENLPL
ncbi:polysaccharide pyruvyl transferase family protein [Bacillus siamensis]|uniref:Pyruvyl transferase n=1 Tax=Bacillus siamensis TaxID=659243 RepID=A0AAI8HKU0_9BACI|nr:MULTISPECIES: polysaccharide pyruvyl transferase family protein [Bacillus]AME07350.1 pyruvyl transferase [Bacillus sp. SDLI1]AUJ75931.1 pyruvyl transferase [Bacillus siamensis]UUA83694.1 polysaccharide pyruvyl transferase family protein [Bacillus siamensis]